MAKGKRHRNKEEEAFTFKSTQRIGASDAESDIFLDQVFIDNGVLDLLKDPKDQRCIIIGRTGSGKSALLKKLEAPHHSIKRIDPEALSLKFLSNSTILNYFKAHDVNLNFFFKVLWKHVFIIELLKLYFGEDNVKKPNWFEILRNKVLSSDKKGPRRERAIKYLEEKGKDFWLYTENRVKSFEEKIQNSFKAETGIDISDVKLGAEAQTAEAKETAIEVKHKAEKVINQSQAEEIHDIIDIMKHDFFDDYQRKHFIIIDDLDKEWIETDMRYQLIGAMIEVIKEFRVFKGAKIIIGLRDNLHQLVFAGMKHKGGQREKFKDLYIDLRWKPEQLKDLLDKRLIFISRSKLDVSQAFSSIRKSGKSGFDYMIERTFYRPRDVISFVNHMIEQSSNESFFSNDIIGNSEEYYSLDRLHAIEDEWGENYGDIDLICKFLVGKNDGFRLNSVKGDDFLDTYCDETKTDEFYGKLREIIMLWRSEKISFQDFLRELLYILYIIGIIGIKKGPKHSTHFIFQGGIPLQINDITNNCRFYIHKAFYSALKINVQEQQIEV